MGRPSGMSRRAWWALRYATRRLERDLGRLPRRTQSIALLRTVLHAQAARRDADGGVGPGGAA